MAGSDTPRRFRCIWLDADIHSKENREIQRRLNDIFGRSRFVDSIAQCAQVINNSDSESTFMLVVSGSLGQQIISSIHDNPKIHSVYVYCGNVEAHKEWSSGYSKVRYFGIIFLCTYIMNLDPSSH